MLDPPNWSRLRASSPKLQRVSISDVRQNPLRMYVARVRACRGAGRRTIAAPLAAALDLPLLARDSIKESLWDALGAGDLAWSRRLGAASAETFWRLADEIASRACSTTSSTGRSRTGSRRSPARCVEVHCACPPELALERYQSRAAASLPLRPVVRRRHVRPVEPHRRGPLALGGPLLDGRHDPARRRPRRSPPGSRDLNTGFGDTATVRSARARTACQWGWPPARRSRAWGAIGQEHLEAFDARRSTEPGRLQISACAARAGDARATACRSRGRRRRSRGGSPRRCRAPRAR